MNFQEHLKKLADPNYRLFQLKLLPTLNPDTVLGVRTPALRRLARENAGAEAATTFLNTLPHFYFDENNLHGALIEYGDYSFAETIVWIEKFLPYIDNWATCDQFIPSIFKKEPESLQMYIKRWLKSERPYTIRFALNCLMKNLGPLSRGIDWYTEIAQIKSDHYYVKMGIAWLYSVALAEDWERAYAVFKNGLDDSWIFRKAIQKGCESYRLTAEQKAMLRQLK